MAGPSPAVTTLTGEEPELEAVLLDMDGTLVDTEDFWWDAEVAVFAELGHELRDEWRSVVVGGPMSRSAGFLIEATAADIGLEELSVLLNARFTERLERGVPLMPGARRLLAELSAHRIPPRRWSPPRTARSWTACSPGSGTSTSPSRSPGTSWPGPSRTPTRI